MQKRNIRSRLEGTGYFRAPHNRCQFAQVPSMTYAAPRHGFRTFVIVWAAQSLSVIGSGMTGFALNVYLAQVLYPAAEQRAELALAFTALNLGFTIPFVFGGPLAGAWADRHDRKQIMIVTNIAKGLITLVTFALMLSGNLQLWMLVCIGVLAAAASAFHYAAFDASYAMLVPDRLLPRANGMMQTTWSLSGIISPALAALIIALPGLLPRDAGLLRRSRPWATARRSSLPSMPLRFSCARSCCCSFTCHRRCAVTLARAAGSSRAYGATYARARAYIWHRPPLMWLLATFVVANLAGAPTGVIVPLLVKFNLEPDWAAARLHLRKRPCAPWRSQRRRRRDRRLACQYLGRAEAQARLWRPRPNAGGRRSPGRLRAFAAACCSAQPPLPLVPPCIPSSTRIRSRSGSRIRRANCRDGCFQSAVLSLGPSCQSRRPLAVRSPALSTLGTSWRASD